MAINQKSIVSIRTQFTEVSPGVHTFHAKLRDTDVIQNDSIEADNLWNVTLDVIRTDDSAVVPKEINYKFMAIQRGRGFKPEPSRTYECIGQARMVGTGTRIAYVFIGRPNNTQVEENDASENN